MIDCWWCVVVCGFGLRLLVVRIGGWFGGCLFKLFSCCFEYCLDWYWLIFVVWRVVLSVADVCCLLGVVIYVGSLVGVSAAWLILFWLI